MLETILVNEPTLRLGMFLGIFAVMAGWEALAPRRARAVSRWVRWPSNLGLVALNTVFPRILIPTAAVGLALLGESRGWGLCNQLSLPYWLTIAAAMVLLDLAIYLQHVLFHAVPVLWRLHRMHHADLDFDVTTGARFHPLEILVSMIIKLAVIAALGPPAVAVLLFEIVLNATAMFNHANVNIPIAIDRLLRLVVVTPDMHRVHHSIRSSETNSNFGFNLPWWDRLFGTYRAQPADGHVDMSIGLEQFRSAHDLRLDRMLLQPLVGDAGNATIDQRGGDV